MANQLVAVTANRLVVAISILSLYTVFYLYLLTSSNHFFYRPDHDSPKETAMVKHHGSSTTKNHAPLLLLKDMVSNSKSQSQTNAAQEEEGNFDVLVVGSMFKENAARTQRETWGSHPSIRHFILATENDDPDPFCHNSTTLEEVSEIASQCGSTQYWENQKAYSKLTRFWGKFGFASKKWLLKKKNPAGWLCAQKRFVSAFTSLAELYRTKYISTLPDYLVIIDDDTYINMENITEYLLKEPQRREDEGVHDNERYVPSPNVPAVFAGCRIRSPVGDIKWTLPFGGFGTFFSRGSLQRFIQPIFCNDGTSESRDPEFELAICQKYQVTTGDQNQLQYPFSATIGESRFFQSSISLNEVFKRYINEMEFFCLHSDFFFGYVANFLNISRHVIPKGELPNIGQGETSRYFDEIDDEKNDPENRLHSIMGSDLYNLPEGNCLFGNGYTNGPTQVKTATTWIPAPKGQKYDRSYKRNQDCTVNATICHYMSEDDMKRMHNE